MLIILAVVVLVPVVVLGTEAMLAKRGVTLENPDVATLSLVSAPARSTGDLRVLWLGDSTAAAVGTSAARYAASSRVGESLSEACGVTVHTRVIAHSGDQVTDLVRDQLPVAKDVGADLVFISVGANDTIHMVSAAKFERGYRTIVDTLVAADIPADHIVLLGVPDMGSPRRLAQPLRAIAGFRSRRLDARVKTVARDLGTRYVDLFKGTSAAFRADPGKLFAADKYHPSDDGYAVWEKTITPVAAPVCSP